MKNYSIFLISNKPDRYAKIQESMLPELLYYFDGSKGPTFSTLVNQCVESSPTEIVIICGDKVYPKQQHIQKILQLLDQGYGLVGLYRFGCFGFRKELFRQVGMFDERYVGGYEDHDFVLRMIMANIAFYLTEEVEYHYQPTTWNNKKSELHWNTKWLKEFAFQGQNYYHSGFKRTLEEETYNYNLGARIPTKFLTCREYSYIQGPGCMFIVEMVMASVT